MRKTMLVVFVLGIGLPAFAQTGDKSRQPPALLTVTASTTQSEARGMRLTGNVSFRLADGTLVSADEAFVNASTYQVEFRGNVRMILAADARVALVTK